LIVDTPAVLITLTEEVDGFDVTVGALAEVLMEPVIEAADFVEVGGGGGGKFDVILDDLLMAMLEELMVMLDELIAMLDELIGAATKAKLFDNWTCAPF